MGDQTRATLPPGCRFYPSEELLLDYYLTNKNENREEGFYSSDLIRELDLYGYDPFELPDAACFSYGYQGMKKHWFCYSVKVAKHTRRVKSGFWLRKGRVRDVFGNDRKVVLGTRTRFVFYVGNSLKNATRTDWILYEYALVDRLLASFVLCRVFMKLGHQKNSPSEIGLSCCAEENMSAVRHVGVQHDGYVGSDVIEEAKGCDDSYVDRKNEMIEHPIGCGGEHDNFAAPPVSVAQVNHQLSLANFYISNNLKSLVRIWDINIASQSTHVVYSLQLHFLKFGKTFLLGFCFFCHGMSPKFQMYHFTLRNGKCVHTFSFLYVYVKIE